MIPSIAAYASLLAFAFQIPSFSSASSLLLSPLSLKAHLISSLALQEPDTSAVYEEPHDSNAHVLASQTLLPPSEPLFPALATPYLDHSPCSEFVEEEPKEVVVVNLEVEVETMVAGAGGCCTEDTAKKGSTQEVAEAASSLNSEMLAAEAGVHKTIRVEEEEAVDKSTAGAGVVEEEGVDLWGDHNVARKMKKVHTHCSFGETTKMELTEQSHLPHHHRHYH